MPELTEETLRAIAVRRGIIAAEKAASKDPAVAAELQKLRIAAYEEMLRRIPAFTDTELQGLLTNCKPDSGCQQEKDVFLAAAGELNKRWAAREFKKATPGPADEPE